MRRLAEIENIGHNVMYRLAAMGEVDTVVIGRCRYVVAQSWHDYVSRRHLGVERNPVERAAAAASYRQSLAGIGGQAAARARRGTRWGRKLAAEAEGGSTPGVLTDPPGRKLPRHPPILKLRGMFQNEILRS
jgi:hypothetical protein